MFSSVATLAGVYHKEQASENGAAGGRVCRDGPALEAGFNFPAGLALNRGENTLYVCDAQVRSVFACVIVFCV